jgi:organic radical activating enzyme
VAAADGKEACGLSICAHCLPCLQDGGVEVNAAKANIDSLTEQLEAKKQAAGSSGSTGGEPGVLDDEHYQLLQELKAAKARY